ncbi:MAG: hypothetical protein B7Z08_11660 [Sphingomonadales bacterium 32-68-7]|nr:MAG: hypothetical protein B7Z33_07660 [Sphingomonadales bacterium 12-68-11]OYX07852.1 MAG: hypothetical protein B7Z08_11660 [Sphingomonadales bacterium 32-68-7]
MSVLRLIALLALPALLAACGGEPRDDDERSASGEVLEGTISDAMLPIDTVSSQPPLAEPVRSGTGSARPDDAASDAVEESAVADDAAASEPDAPAPAAAAE